MRYNAMRTPLIKNGQLKRRARVSFQRIRTDVILGSPSANCHGVGICRVLAHREEEPSSYSCPRVNSWLSVTETGRLRFEFEKNSLDKDTLERHFKWKVFQVTEAYVIPYSLLRHLRIAERTIKPGVYPVWDTGHHLVVYF